LGHADATRGGRYLSLLAFTPDGKSLLLTSGSSVLVSSCDTKAIIAEACARLDRNLDDTERR
jgi:hypothetical protein